MEGMKETLDIVQNDSVVHTMRQYFEVITRLLWLWYLLNNIYHFPVLFSSLSWLTDWLTLSHMTSISIEKWYICTPIFETGQLYMVVCYCVYICVYISFHFFFFFFIFFQFYVIRRFSLMTFIDFCHRSLPCHAFFSIL